MKQKKSQPQKSKPPRKSVDISVTSKMLDEARYELKHEIESFRHEVKGEFKSVRSDISKVQANVEKVQANVEKVQANVEKVLAAVHRVGLLVEDQNARNKYVLDGYTSISDRLDKVEKQTKDV